GVGGPANAPRKIFCKRCCASFSGYWSDEAFLSMRGPAMTRQSPSITKLSTLIKDQTLTPEEFDAHFEELVGTNDRLIAIVGGAMVEAALAHAIREKMIPLNKRNDDRIFGQKAPLGTFSAKIDVAYALGLISEDVQRNADYIRAIRN